MLKTLCMSVACAALVACGGQENVQVHDHITMDPITVDAKFPPAQMELDFLSAGEAMNGHFYLANGEGPHPIVILLHGLPGNEKNLDIAQAARRSGFNVLFFHYRGAWGSAGDFSFVHVVEDALAASAFVRSPESIEKYRIDPNHISFIGHSMGGFAALAAGAQDKNVGCIAAISPADLGLSGRQMAGAESAEARAQFAAYLDGATMLGKGPLSGFKGADLVAEIVENTESFSVAKMGGEFSGRTVFITAAKADTVLPPEVFFTPLLAAYDDGHNINLTHKLFEGDHAYSWSRMALTNEIVHWLEGNCR